MYFCEECGTFFEMPDTIYEPHPYGEGYATEEWAVCPCCKESGFVEVFECQRCGKYYPALENGLCTECHGDMYGE